MKVSDLIKESISIEDTADARQVFKDWTFIKRISFGFTDIDRFFEKYFSNGKVELVDISLLKPHHDWGRRPESENPPIIMRLKNSELVILDGQHRVLAAKDKGKTDIQCYVFDAPIRYSKPTKKYLVDE